MSIHDLTQPQREAVDLIVDSLVEITDTPVQMMTMVDMIVSPLILAHLPITDGKIDRDSLKLALDLHCLHIGLYADVIDKKIADMFAAQEAADGTAAVRDEG